MKRTGVLFRWFSIAAPVIMPLLVLTGCTGKGDAGGDSADIAARQYGLERSEYIALKKANKKNPRKLEKAIQEKTIEKMKEMGVSVKVVSPPNKTAKRQ